MLLQPQGELHLTSNRGGTVLLVYILLLRNLIRMAAKWTNRWVLKGQKGLDSLEFQKGAQVPDVGPEDVLV